MVPFDMGTLIGDDIAGEIERSHRVEPQLDFHLRVANRCQRQVERMDASGGLINNLDAARYGIFRSQEPGWVLHSHLGPSYVGGHIVASI